MLLRSSSTPLIPTLPSPFFSDTPPAHRDFDPISAAAHKNCKHRRPSSGEFDPKPHNLRLSTHRRSRSDSNLEGLAFSGPLAAVDSPNSSLARAKLHQTMLDPAPSFSIYNPPDGFEDPNGEGSEGLARSVAIGDDTDAMSSGDFTFSKKGMGFIKEEEDEEKEEEEENSEGIRKLGVKEEGEPASPPMYLAAGLGIEAVAGFGHGGVDFSAASVGESCDVEEHYKRMVEEYPCHPLFLRNYAQLLQSKGDLGGAEQYYHRATLAEPGDGEILMLFASLVWELHRDEEKALHYFERAAEAAPTDSHVLAAYAGFLWETEDDEGEDSGQHDDIQMEGGLEKPEEYYPRTTLAKPGDGEIMTQYAKMLWELHGDRDKASSYFERAVEASPEDSHVLAAYASFLWETEDEADEDAQKDDIGVPLFRGIGAPANA